MSFNLCSHWRLLFSILLEGQLVCLPVSKGAHTRKSKVFQTHKFREDRPTILRQMTLGGKQGSGMLNFQPRSFCSQGRQATIRGVWQKLSHLSPMRTHARSADTFIKNLRVEWRMTSKTRRAVETIMNVTHIGLQATITNRVYE